MRIIDITKHSSNELASKDAALTLLKDGVVVFPTDTLYGLGVNALDELAVEKLFKIKKRPKEKPVPLMVSSIEMARAVAFIDKSRERLLQEMWPGPFTAILWKRKLVPKTLTAGSEKVAIRIPAHPFCQMVLRDFEGPVTITSANISGEEPMYDSSKIVQRFQKENEKPDLIIDSGSLPQNDPSALIDLTSDSPKLLRVNPTSREKLLKLLELMS